jgi:hypothetical protein
MVQFGGVAIETEPLTGGQWGGCLAIAMLPLVWGFIFGLLPDSLTRAPWMWMYHCLDNVATVLPCIKGCHTTADQRALNAEAGAAMEVKDASSQHLLPPAPLVEDQPRRPTSKVTVFSTDPDEAPLSMEDVPGVHLAPAGSSITDVDDALSVTSSLPPDASPQLRRAVSVRSNEQRARNRWQAAISDVQTQISVIDLMRRHRR